MNKDVTWIDSTPGHRFIGNTMTPEQKTRQTAINTAFTGKTIKNIVADTCNVWTFHFTDGTRQQIEAEQAVSTPYGSIAGIFMSQELSATP